MAITPQAQFLEASSRSDDESAEIRMASAIEEFPDDLFYTPMGKTQLAFLYLQPPFGDEQHLEKAKALFEQLATSYRNADKKFRPMAWQVRLWCIACCINRKRAWKN